MTSNTRLTGYSDSGDHKVTIIAKDVKGNQAENEVVIVVKDSNRAPTFNPGAFS
jgi:hypothetical protein